MSDGLDSGLIKADEAPIVKQIRAERRNKKKRGAAAKYIYSHHHRHRHHRSPKKKAIVFSFLFS
ncbi:predicted protein [Arabidopsis lyrata subsp. lyrata]|uniref:Predicted protein n=1 Tax=Arabidopsis lyrata subsp. lyrata TaxID=81972 RepID=D7M1W3_ARALL|nr:predicted protein [Arabidopsis lyrata subsp. lyrata]